MISKFKCESYAEKYKYLAPEACAPCSDAGIACDRKRPRCATCHKKKIPCPGYSTKLKWVNTIASRGKYKGRTSFAEWDSNENTVSTSSEASVQMDKKELKKVREKPAEPATNICLISPITAPNNFLLNIVSRSYLPFIDLFGIKGRTLFLSVTDIPMNPFEAILRNAIFLTLSPHNSNNCLMDGIAAISSWIMDFDKGDMALAFQYKSKALQGLVNLIQSVEKSAGDDLLLCAAQGIVAIASFDEMVSCKSNWKAHYHGLNFILKNMSMTSTWHPAFKGAVAWLGWCDLAIAFTSRELPVISKEYWYKCTSNLDYNRDGWDIYSLTGLDEELSHYIQDIVVLAHKYKTNGGIIFLEEYNSIQLILQDITGKVKNLKTEDAESAEFCRTCDYNVWAIGIIIYCYSVFQEYLIPPYAGYEESMAKSMLSWAKKPRKDHPCCKQMILPLFLASQYINDENDRQWVRDFHMRWRGLLSMRLLDDSLAMIEKIWKENKTWVEVLDEQQLKGEQCLLG